MDKPDALDTQREQTLGELDELFDEDEWPYCACNLDLTIEEMDWGVCGCCGKPIN